MFSKNIAKTSSRFGIDRRSFIRLVSAGSAFLAASKAQSPTYNVGVGYNTNPYTAASTALSACGQFPTNLAGQTVVIKPNLVVALPASSGATTDPRVVKAIVDLFDRGGRDHDSDRRSGAARTVFVLDSVRVYGRV